MPYKYFSPLQRFICDLDEFQVTKYLTIKKDAYRFRKIDEEFYLAQWEINQINECSHWAVVENIPRCFSSSSEVINTLLLALWIHSPTSVSVGFQFGVGASDKYSRLHDHFQSNGVEGNKDIYTPHDLEEIKTIFIRLAQLKRIGKRLYATIVYSVFACFQVNWKSAFMLSSTALESLLTYGSKRDVTNSLARAYCCFTESNKYKRDLAFKKFKKIYRIRSELVHGRFIKRDDARRNLKSISVVTTVLRKMWKKVLNSPVALKELEKADPEREVFFLALTRGYVNP